MKTFALALIASLAAAKEYCTWRCHWDPNGDIKDGWDSDRPCEDDGFFSYEKNCYEMSEAEHAAKMVKDELEKAVEDMEREIHHAQDKDWDWEMAKTWRDL
jgi:hypothetical protein